MEILTILIVILLVLLALALVVFPLWQQTRPEAPVQVTGAGRTLEEYHARYQATLASIKDLMFDREMGKVSDDDYQLLLNKAKLEAAGYRQEIERLGSGLQPVNSALDTEIETLVGQFRNGTVQGSSELLQAVDAEIARLKRPHGGLACPNCAHPFQPGDAFCAGCGQSLKGVAVATGANICPKCNAPTQPKDSFCARCGQTLTPAVPASSR